VRRVGPALLRWLILLALWEIAGRFRLVAGGALPAPSAILVQAWADRDIYPAHIMATLVPASIGFLIGNAVAVTAAILFALSPVFERLMRLVGIAVFAIPAIALAPVLVITLKGDGPQIALAAISVYFPTMVATLLGLREVDPRPIDMIRSYGGGRIAILRYVRWRSALPAMLGGFRLAAPAAVLGAILAEFGSGARWGLGSFLLGSLGRANPARLWGIGLAATLLAGVAYAVFSWAGQRLARGTLPATIAVGQPPAPSGRAGPILMLAACIMPFMLWQAVLSALGISPVIARTPLMVLQDLTISPSAAATRAAIGGALAQSLPLAAAGLALGLGSALALAMAGVLRPRLTAAVMPMALVLQTMPLVALTPLIVLLFGRDIAATLVITVSVTVFPAFITIAQGLAQVPRPATDLLRVYGATRWQVLRLAALPGALPYLSAAARLVAPRALLGVMIAEWLATGYGLGNLLNEARGELDYGMIWAVTFVSAAISVGFYLAVEAMELRLLGRFRAG
jgi:ABC-type nitrate/sulfonate/bicarbonate transport system permease component